MSNKISELIDRTTPKTPEEAAKRRQKVGAAVLSVLSLSALVGGSVANEAFTVRESTTITVTDQNDLLDKVCAAQSALDEANPNISLNNGRTSSCEGAAAMIPAEELKDQLKSLGYAKVTLTIEQKPIDKLLGTTWSFANLEKPNK